MQFEDYFDKYYEKYVGITLDDEHSVKLGSAVNNLIKRDERKLKRKLNEYEIRRYEKIYLSVVGDVILEQYLDLNFVDYSAIEDTYGISEINTLINRNIDVIAFTYGCFPLVYPKTYRTTIFVCKLSKKDFFICGVADAKTVNNYSLSKLVCLDNLKGIKKGFFGFEHLTPIPDNIGLFLELIDHL